MRATQLKKVRLLVGVASGSKEIQASSPHDTAIDFEQMTG